MKIIVTIKQVPESNEVQVDPETLTLKRDTVAGIINPFDMYAIEEALRIKEKNPDETTVCVVTMGPPQAESALREAMAMGVDEVWLVSDKKFAGSDTWATSYTLARAAEKIGDFDLIIAGKQAFDGDTAQVPPEMSEFLSLPFCGFVKKIEQLTESLMVVERMTEEGYNRVEIALPAVISVVKGINVPRLPSLKGKIRARKATIQTLNADDLEADEANIGLVGSPTQVVKVFTPEYNTESEVIEGSPQEQAGLLITKLQEANIL